MKKFYEKYYEFIAPVWCLGSIFMVVAVIGLLLWGILDIVERAVQFHFVCSTLGEDIQTGRYTDKPGIKYYKNYCGRYWEEGK